MIREDKGKEYYHNVFYKSIQLTIIIIIIMWKEYAFLM